MLYPRLGVIRRQRLWTEQFTGLDRRPRTYDGAFSAMGNMTGEPWPLLSARKKRGLVCELEEPHGLCALGKLAWIDGSTLYFDGEATAINTLSTAKRMLPKRMVTMGAYILIFPDKVYYNTVNPADSGEIERLYQSSGPVSISLCGMDGTDYPAGSLTVSDTAPANPSSGDYWLNTGGETHTLYQYLGGEWQGISTVYVKISATGIGRGLNTLDSVTVSGIAYNGANETLRDQLELLNATHVIQAAGEDYIVVIGVVDQAYTQTAGAVRADRKIPDMDFMVECNNRLWGCRYGEQDGEIVNRIYASALGDFKNWQQYQGTSQDSYYVNVGTDGPFTGAIVHRGSPYFFKSDCIHKVYGERPSNFQTQVMECDGVKPGCGGTLTAYNGALYYVSENGVQAFESLPENVGPALGPEKLFGGAAGQCGGKYYLSVQGQDGQYDLYVLDTARKTWHREDDSRALAFASLDGEMYMLLENGLLYALNGTKGTAEAENVSWYAETAVMGYEYPEHKYLGRFLLRLKLGADAECRLLIQYDSDGIWRPQGVIRGDGKVKTCLVPVIPRRCEHLQVRIEGDGEMQLYGMARELALGA